MPIKVVAAGANLPPETMLAFRLQARGLIGEDDVFEARGIALRAANELPLGLGRVTERVIIEEQVLRELALAKSASKEREVG